LAGVGNTLKVLICDDSLLIRKKLRDTLEKCGVAEILEAENGYVGVNLAKEHSPELIFMDIVMPDKDGIEALKEIKAFQPQAKVVMASSVGTNEYLKKALENGAYDFIQKPLNVEGVSKLVEKVLKERSVNV
jgi:two-component system, chemotaxis family, chemotaxis protein CheY